MKKIKSSELQELLEYVEKYHDLYVDWGNSTLLLKKCYDDLADLKDGLIIQFEDNDEMYNYIRDKIYCFRALTPYVEVGTEDGESYWAEVDFDCL